MVRRKTLTKTPRWDGVLSITYDRQEKDIFYYNVDIKYRNERVQIHLPRYAPMIGWIEVFGLPPQNEWVVLDSTIKLKKNGALSVKYNGDISRIKENFSLTTDLKKSRRTIRLSRSLGDVFENQLYSEDWSKLTSKNVIHKRIRFEHSEGSYDVTLACYKSPTIFSLSLTEKKYLGATQKVRGKSKEVWLKKFSMHGVPPPLYYTLFPFWKGNWKEGTGRALEIGYEKEMSHGDWYKLFTIGKRRFEIKEDNWRSKSVKYRGRRIHVKETYRKYIRELF